MRRIWIWTGIAAGVSVFGLVGACGNGDDSSSASDASTDRTSSGDDASFDGGGGGGDDGSTSDGNAMDAPIDTGFDAGCTANPCIVQISAAGDQSCALVSDGTIRCWGENAFGQLGTGGYPDGGLDGSARGNPLPVPGATGVSQVVTAEWGSNVASGGAFAGFTCARTGTTMVSCWGNNRDGQLGRGPDAGFARVNLDASAVIGLTSPSEIALDARNGCALSSTGAISCWGYGYYGEVGPIPGSGGGDVPPSSFIIDGGTPTHIAIGRYHSCALLTSGQVMCWGRNQFDEIGQIDAGPGLVHPNPVLVPGVSNAVDIVSGGFQTCVRTQAGQVLCWGRNNLGQLGRDAGQMDVAGPVDLPTGHTAKLLGIATNHACVALDDDSVWCWGRNFAGNNGNGSSAPMHGPPSGQIGATPDGGFTSTLQPIGSLGGTVKQIVGGYAHTCALLTDGSVKCWGANNAGQLGTGTIDTMPHPTPVSVQF